MTTPLVTQVTTPAIPGLTDDEQRTVSLLIGQLAAKAPRNLIRSAFYDMKNVVRDLGISTPPSMVNVPHVLGWSAKAVDILNRRCPLDGFVVPGVKVEDGDPFGVQKVWTDNYLDLEAAQAGVSSLIHCASFLIATQGDPDRDEPEVLVTARDALSGTGEWSRRLRRLTSFLSVIDTSDTGAITEFVLYLPGLNVSCIKDPVSNTWSVDRSEHAYGLPVEVLPYQPRLGRPFGSSRISRSVMSLHGAAVRSFRRSESTAEFYAATRVALLGAGEEAFKNPDGSPTSKWTAALSAIWAVPDDEDATNPRATLEQIQQASQEPHMAQLRSLAQLFAGETGIPLSSLGISGDANPTSSEAYDAGREDLMQEAEGTTDAWSPGWRRTMLRALSMLNGWDTPPDEALTLAPKWRDPRTPSRAAAADAAVKLVTVFPWLADTPLGLELAGLDQQFITRAMAAKRQANGRATLNRILPAAPVEAARSMTAPAAADQRAALQAVTGAALSDLATEWATLDLGNALQVKATLQELLPSLAEEYGAAASQLAVDVYESLRDAAGFTSGYEPQIATVTDKMPSRARWSADPLFDRADPQPDVALVRAQESVQLAVADQYRETITDTAIDDPEARGWQRVVRPEASKNGPCAFCVLLASRGAVYTRKSVDFGAHGLCHCIAVPAWGGREVPVKPFEPTGNSTPEQRARVYRYMRAHGLLDGRTRRPTTSRR